jgi:GT2 family glycosyltransferase
LRGSALIDVGGFDEGFFLYSEEADWEKRAVQRGWLLLFCPDISATHVSGGTDKDEDRFSLRSKAAIELYLRKWYGVTGWRSYQLAVTTAAISRALFTSDPAERGYLLREARRWIDSPHRSALRAGVIPERRHYVPSLARTE